MTVIKEMEMQQYFRGLNYPAYKKDLLLKAENLGADDKMLDLIFALPTRKYQPPAEVR